MIQNLDAHLNKLQAQCDYLRNKVSTFPDGELIIYSKKWFLPPLGYQE